MTTNENAIVIIWAENIEHANFIRYKINPCIRKEYSAPVRSAAKILLLKYYSVRKSDI